MRAVVVCVVMCSAGHACCGGVLVCILPAMHAVVVCIVMCSASNVCCGVVLLCVRLFGD